MRKERKIINTNIRLNLCDEQDRQAWEYLQTMDREKYKSYTRAVVVALNDYFSREYRNEADPYLETREKEDAFLERVETAVRDGVKESVPMAIAKNLMEMLVPFVKESVGEINLLDRTLTMEKTDGEIMEDNLDWEKEADMDAALELPLKQCKTYHNHWRGESLLPSQFFSQVPGERFPYGHNFY